jgi:hypothetical protein
MVAGREFGTACAGGGREQTVAASRALFWGAVAIVAVPFVVGMVADLVRGPGAFWIDQASMEMAVRDVGRHPVLIGLYSRGVWSHPGPALYYTLALPYRLTGSGTAGLLVGALLINLGAIVGMGAIARRLGGTAAALVTLVVAGVTARALGPEFLHDPWVCYVSVLPFGLFCCLVWAMTAGRIWALPAAAALASWLVQVHVMYAALTAPLVVLGALWLVVVTWRAAEPGRMARLWWGAGAAVAVVAVMWAPPLWDQVLRTGNLGRVVDYFRESDEPVHTLADGGRIVFGQLSTPPDWLTGTRRTIGYGGETTLLRTTLWPVLLLPFAAALILAWRRRYDAVLRLGVVTAVALVVGVVAVSRTLGLMHEYRLLWTWITGMLVGVVILWVAWLVVAARWPEAPRRVLVPLGLVALAGLSVAQVVEIVQAGRPDIYSPETEAVAERLAEQLDPDRGEVLVNSGSPHAGFYRQGVLNELERRGFDVRVVRELGDILGPQRVVHRDPQTSLLVVTDGELRAALADPTLELVAYAGPQSVERRAELVRRADVEQARISRRFRDRGMSQEAFLRDYAATAVPGVAIAVFRVAPEAG